MEKLRTYIKQVNIQISAEFNLTTVAIKGNFTF